MPSNFLEDTAPSIRSLNHQSNKKQEDVPFMINNKKLLEGNNPLLYDSVNY